MRVTPERRATGTDPVSLLPQKAKVVRLERLPNEAGIEPVKLLPLMFKVVRAVRLPSEAGKEPDTRRFLFPTSMPVILPLVTVIPGQSFIFVQPCLLPLTIHRPDVREHREFSHLHATQFGVSTYLLHYL